MDGYQPQANWAQDVLQASASFWSPLVEPKTDPTPKSWYRPPAPNPFDLSAWGVPTPFQTFGGNSVAAAWFNPWAGFGSNLTAPFTGGFGTSAFHIPWSTIASVATAMAAVQPSASTGWFPSVPTYRPAEPSKISWDAFFWPMTQLNALAAVATASTAFSNYRSDSGHAVAHIVHGTEKAPEADMTAIYAFAWPSFTVH